MENLQLSWSILIFIGLAATGQLANILFKLSKLEKVSDFKFSIWIGENVFTTLFGFIASILLVFWLYGKGTLDYSTSVMMGFIADSAIKTLSSKYKKALK